MKKALSILLAVIMIVSLAACSNQPKESTAENKPADPPKTTEQNATQAEPKTTENTGVPEAPAGYPSGTIQFQVGYAAGGGVDISVRLMTKYLQKYFSVPIIVNNITGASGAVMTEDALKYPADGLTIISTATGTPLADITGSGSFSYLDDFEYVAQQDTIPYVISFRANDERFSTPEECLDYIRKHPGELSIGISGVNNACHLTAVSFVQDNNLDVTIVPFNGGADVKQNFLGGHVDLACDSLADSKVTMDEGASKVLVLCTENKMDGYLGDAKTASELGLKFRCNATTRGYLVKKGTDPAIVEYLSYLIGEVCKDPAFIQEYMTSGLGPCVTFKGTKEFTEYTRNEYQGFLELARSLKIAVK